MWSWSRKLRWVKTTAPKRRDDYRPAIYRGLQLGASVRIPCGQGLGQQVWLGFSVEDSEATLTAHGNTAVHSCSVVRDSQPACNTERSAAAPLRRVDHDVASHVATTCTALANYSFNPSPDFVAKLHSSLALDTMKSSVSQRLPRSHLPRCGAKTPSVAGAFNSSTWSGGGGNQRRWSMFQKHIDLGIHPWRVKCGTVRNRRSVRCDHQLERLRGSDREPPGAAVPRISLSQVGLVWLRGIEYDGRPSS